MEVFEISEIVSLMSEYSSSVDGDAKPEVVVEDIMGIFKVLYSYLSKVISDALKSVVELV